MIPVPIPYLVAAFVADLIALVLVALLGSAGDAERLELDTLALVLGGAVGGAAATRRRQSG